MNVILTKSNCSFANIILIQHNKLLFCNHIYDRRKFTKVLNTLIVILSFCQFFYVEFNNQDIISQRNDVKSFNWCILKKMCKITQSTYKYKVGFPLSICSIYRNTLISIIEYINGIYTMKGVIRYTINTMIRIIMLNCKQTNKTKVSNNSITQNISTYLFVFICIMEETVRSCKSHYTLDSINNTRSRCLLTSIILSCTIYSIINMSIFMILYRIENIKLLTWINNTHENFMCLYREKIV